VNLAVDVRQHPAFRCADGHFIPPYEQTPPILLNAREERRARKTAACEGGAWGGPAPRRPARPARGVSRRWWSFGQGSLHVFDLHQRAKNNSWYSEESARAQAEQERQNWKYQLRREYGCEFGSGRWKAKGAGRAL